MNADDLFEQTHQRCLDIAFVLGASPRKEEGMTSSFCSMGSYISAATTHIHQICDMILASDKLSSASCLRIALVAYRDHPPQDHTWLLKTFPFTSDVSSVRENLKSLYASGGGDGPEASTAALNALTELDWRPDASKMALLITDAPPHGIGEYGDGFPDGSPDGVDPLQLVRVLASRGIVLFVVACEPALSGYTYATDFYRALSQITSGVMLPLTTANLLAHVIVGSALEQLDMERLIQEVGHAVAERVHGNQESVDDVARALHEQLMIRNESTKQLHVEDIYRDIPEAQHNVSVWMNVSRLSEAKSQLQRVQGSRFSEKYLQQRRNASNAGRYATYPTIFGAPYKPADVPKPAPASVSPPGSPSRKIISDFKPFSAPTTMSMASARAAGSSPFGGSNSASAGSPPPHGSPPGPGGVSGGASAFGLRSGGSSAPPSSAYALREATRPDDDDEDGLQAVEFKLASISFDQARRITMQAAWRGAGAA